MSNVPKNLRYDQTSQSTLAEFLVATQAPEGNSTFQPGAKIDFRFSMTGGYVTSWASSTLDFDVVCKPILGAIASADDAHGICAFDPYLGAHQLIQRITVTVGGNIIEDHRDYPLIYKCMKAMHSNQERRFIDTLESRDQTSMTTTNWKNGNAVQNTEPGLQPYAFSETAKRSVNNTAPTPNTSDTRFRCRLNLLSCLGSLAGAKYWPNVLLNSDVRLEIYLNSLTQGMIFPPAQGAVTAPGSWHIENVQYTMSNVRLNTQVINALKSTGGVQMIMPGFTVQQNTLPSVSAAGASLFENIKYSSSASSLKNILLVFRDPLEVAKFGYNSYNFVEPMGLTHQFLIGSTLMPARPVDNLPDRFREFQRCIGGPANSCDQKTLIRAPNWLHPPSQDGALNRGSRLLGLVPDSDLTSYMVAACHILGQSLEMYADHTLSSVVFSGINAVNLIMQCQLKLTGTSTPEGDLHLRAGTTWTNVGVAYMVDSIMVYDRLLEFKNGEVVMGY